MSLAERLTMNRSSLRLPRRTVRLRLALLYSALFLAAGVGLLTVTYLLVRSDGIAEVDKTVLPLPSVPAPGGKSPAKPLPSALLRELRQRKAQALATHAADVHELLTTSGIALAIMAALAVVLGWLVAGRVLRPLRTITTTTQQISERNLHERLAPSGPADEIKDLADTINGLLHRLEAAFDAQRQFVANASHELQTPLTLNRALLDVTLANPHATLTDLRTMGQELIASGEQQQQLIDALLTLATSARGVEQHEPFDLADITTDVLRSLHPEIDQLELDVQSTITPAPTVGDPHLARRLVTNLVENALRHNITRGHITIATRTESQHAILTITNSGPIIPRDEIDRLFQPFQRLHNGRANHADGHGLGLSIVQAIASAHDATVSARALPGGGFHIEVRFPPAHVPSSANTTLH